MRAAILLLAMAAFFCHAVDASAGQAQVGNFSDLTLPAWSIGDPAVAAHLDLCVYATGLSSGSYSVTVSSIGAFNLVKGLMHIPYSVAWDDGGAGNLGNGNGAAIGNLIPLTSQTGAGTTSKTCGGGLTARLNLRITQAAMTAALGGTYGDVLTVLIVPN